MIAAEYQAPWREAELADICGKPQYGYTTKASSEGSVKFLRTTDITKGPIRWKTVPFCEIPPEDIQKYRLEHRDIVISRAGSIGFSSLMVNPPDNSVFASYLIRFKPSEQISEHYLKRFLESHDYWNQLASMSVGNAVQNVNAQKLSKIVVPIAPLAEQNVISDKLDTLLAQVENTQARLERIPQILKRFRQSVLAAAVSGKLTEEWRNNSTYNKEGYPESWTFKYLSEVGQLARGKSKHRPRNDPRLFGEEYPFIQTGEVANTTGEITSATRFYSEFGLQQSRLFPAGTLCITIAANIADTAILGIDACFPDSVVGFTPNDSDVLTYFVKYLMEVNKQDLESFAPATAQKNINLKVLNELQLPFPPLEEQTEIVRRVDQLFAHADRIEQQVNQALARVNNLTQSILAKAFRGELTEQWRKDNPELISGENSAEVLLARIKAEQAAKTPAKRTRKKATA